jgi:hypothetical protein
MTLSEIEYLTFRFVAQYFNPLRYSAHIMDFKVAYTIVLYWAYFYLFKITLNFVQLARIQVFTVVAMKNVVFGIYKPSLYLTGNTYVSAR